MKNYKNIPAQVAKKLAMQAIMRDANSTTCFAIYQPKVPAKLKLFKKARNV